MLEISNTSVDKYIYIIMQGYASNGFSSVIALSFKISGQELTNINANPHVKPAIIVA